MAGAIAQDRERCQFPFVLDEKPSVVPGGWPGEQSEGREMFFIAPLGQISPGLIARKPGEPL